MATTSPVDRGFSGIVPAGLARWNWRTGLLIVIPLLLLPFFVTAALPRYDMPQRLLAWLVFTVGIAPGLRYFANPRGVPIIPLVGVQYALAFGLPVFFETNFRVAGNWYLEPESHAVTLALGCALLAVTYILIGNTLALRLLHIRYPIARREVSSPRLLAYGLTVLFGGILLYWTGIGWRFQGPVEILFPRSLGLAVLACVYHAGGLPQIERWAVIGAFALATAWGLLGSMTQATVEPLLIWALARWIVRKKAPVGLGLTIVVLVMLLQPVKSYYRGLMGAGSRTFTPAEAIGVYVSLARTYWSAVGDQGLLLEQGQASAAQRLSMLQSSAHYIQLTPESIPYKGPRTLLYPTYSWMPRALWPDKPTAQEANKVLPVEYGVQSPDNLATTMFGVGHVVEVYTALGFVAIMPVFLIIGILYAVPQIALGGPGGRTLAGVAMLLWFAVNMMHVGSTIGTVFGGLLQQLIVQGTIFHLLAIAPRRAPEPRPALRGSSARG
jgi:hypothetical protein